jgi:hypothetical protein
MARNFGIRRLQVVDGDGFDDEAANCNFRRHDWLPEPELTWPRVLVWSLALSIAALPLAWWAS